MAYDKIYYFDKINHRRYELGEIQTNFNLNIVIDGDKDSMQIDVHSYSREALQPNTIIYHANDPLQWFVVKKDNVKRNANEKGFYYIHSITLNGAIDLTKNRDLTDCGFSANGYTIDEFFKKLLKLSNFEFDYEIDYGNNVDKDKKADYIKSYENYTLLSAIRDFFNGYNCEVKLGFETQQTNRHTRIRKAIFKIIPRTGNIDLTPIDISEFNDIRESINFDKESYGTTVISNAQNVVSTLAKTYPQTGGVTITGTTYDTNVESAYIKLPSPVWKVNWVKVITPTILVFKAAQGGVHGTTETLNFDKAFEEMINNYFVQQYPEFVTLLNRDKEKIREMFENNTMTLYNNPKYDPRTDQSANEKYGWVIKEENTPYIPVISFQTNLGEHRDDHQITLMDKDSASLLKVDKISLVWERGSEKITGLKSLFGNESDYADNINAINQEVEESDLRGIGNRIDYSVDFYVEVRGAGRYNYQTKLQQYVKGQTFFQVNYIPMSDLKVKQDNENNNNDIQLYNQNGKLNDSVALSKMVDSYSKEITNPTITRYGEYYNISDVPKVGQIVMDGNTKYVINNISYNLYPCESDDEDEVNYYCECEFTLAEFISTKSIMTSPNTNVRDYGIPQKYNIKRRQVYRDYYEFGFNYETLANRETPYAKLENYLQLSDSATPKDFDHTALIKIKYEQPTGTNPSDTWYYQLNSTAYTMAKSVYEVIDFDDNNIIGYDIANSTTGFNMSNLWDSRYRAVTTPVSYVDDNGKFVGITLQMTGKDTLEQAYSQIDTQNNPVMFSAHCFIPKEIYDLVAEAPIETLSDSYTKTINFVIDPMTQLGYNTTFNVSASDLGIPDYIEITSETILGLADQVVLVNNSQISGTYILAISSVNNDRTISISFGATRQVLGNSGTLKITFKVNYYGKTSIADYVIDEQDYNKDPIEVPVFEYSLQFGDTKEVEVGDNILKNDAGMLSFYTAVVVSKNTATPLNASKWFTGLDISGDTYSDPTGNYDCLIEVADTSSVNFALEDNNKKLRIKVFTNLTATFYGVLGNDASTNTFSFDNVVQSGNQYTKDYLKDKDIIIFRHTINQLTYTSNDRASGDYTTELMYIIHAPQDAQFENDDLVLKLNYYKLR